MQYLYLQYLQCTCTVFHYVGGNLIYTVSGALPKCNGQQIQLSSIVLTNL